MAIIIIAAIATTSSTTNVMAATADTTVMSTTATTGTTTAAAATATPTTPTVMSGPDPAISRQEAQRGGQRHRANGNRRHYVAVGTSNRSRHVSIPHSLRPIMTGGGRTG